MRLTMFLLVLQYMTEKMGGAEGTQMDVDFMDMERVSHVTLCFLIQYNFIIFVAIGLAVNTGKTKYMEIGCHRGI